MSVSGMPPSHFVWIAASVFLLGLTKGGLPVGPLALPILVLAWPEQSAAARSAVGFMLPLLCLMDVNAVIAWRRHIRWRLIVPLVPWAAIGVAAASLVFLRADGLGAGLSDRVLKFLIGAIGMGFVLHRTLRSPTRSDAPPRPGPVRVGVMGLAAGVTSTIAHSAGPLAQMYFLALRIPKNEFAATLAGFFFLLNLIKVPPYAVFGMIRSDNLLLAAMLAPLAPVGVLAGWVLVRKMNATHYIRFIHVLLFGASAALIIKSFTDG